MLNTNIIILLCFITILLIIVYKLNDNNIENFESILSNLKKNSNKKSNKNSDNNSDNNSKKKNITFDELMKNSEEFSKKKDKLQNFSESIFNYKNSFKSDKFKNNSKNTAESFEKFALYKEKFFDIFK